MAQESVRFFLAHAKERPTFERLGAGFLIEERRWEKESARRCLRVVPSSWQTHWTRWQVVVGRAVLSSLASPSRWLRLLTWAKKGESKLWTQREVGGTSVTSSASQQSRVSRGSSFSDQPRRRGFRASSMRA